MLSRGRNNPADSCTLGSFAYVIQSGRNNIDSQFLLYAQRELYTGFSAQQTEAALQQSVAFLEYVRNHYRNPAAHKNALNLTSAKDCLDYVVEVEYKLKYMLETMSW